MDAAQPPRDPEGAEAAGAPAQGEIDPATTVGAVHLTVRDLERSLRFYREAIGLSVLDTDGDRAALGVEFPGDDRQPAGAKRELAGDEREPTWKRESARDEEEPAAGKRELIVLYENPEATSGRGYSGLYHFALLVPERGDLATWLAHAAREQVPMTGFSDHFVSEALYLQDPDGHGIEIYRDRPRELWEGRVGTGMTTMPLDVEDLMTELPDLSVEPFTGLPGGTRMGHIHLRVAHVPETVAFYRDALGLGLMAELGGQAAFLSAGGYHHHIGVNSWESAGVGAAPDGAATLRHATILLPDQAALDATVERATRNGSTPETTSGGLVATDPSGNRLHLTVT